MREYLILEYLKKNGGRATRQELKTHLFQIAGLSTLQDSIIALTSKGAILRPGSGVYTLPDFKPKPLGQKQNP